ncbi:MAG: hypothetical protein NVSMB51_06900 [Solirubrobacteraceae bacterium]
MVAADVDRALAVLADVDAYPDWYPGVERSTVLARDARQRPLSARLQIGTGVPRYGSFEVELAFAWTPTGLVLRRTAGRATRVDATWQLAPAGAYTRVTLALELELDTGLPRLVERPLGPKVRELMIEGPVAALVERIGGPPSHG